MGLGLPGVARRLLAYPHISRMVRTTATVTLPVVLTFAGCGGGGGDDEATPAATGEPAESAESATGAGATEAAGLPPCSEERHMVMFDFGGMMTMQEEGEIVTNWLNEQIPPDPRPGAPELTQAYRERGYEILYLTTAPPALTFDGLPVPAAAEEWLQTNGFAAGVEGTRVHGHSRQDLDAALLSITDELLRLSGEGVTMDASYTDDEDRVYPLAAGGIPAERIYMIGPDAGAAGTTAIPNDDLHAHLATAVEELPPVCTPA